MPEPDALEALAAQRRDSQARAHDQQTRAQRRAKARAAFLLTEGAVIEVEVIID